MQETLPIQGSDLASAEGLLLEIRRVNLSLDQFLTTDVHSSSDAIDLFSAAVQQRAQLIGALQRCCQELEHSDIPDVHTVLEKFWSGFRVEMTAGDEKRIALLKNKVELAAQSLRRTQKQRTLLQYQRG